MKEEIIYVHPQEIWNEEECEKRAKYAPKDPWGNRPPKGIISHTSSPYIQYGDRTKNKGGVCIDGVFYAIEHKPLPKIPDSYEFLESWGWGILIRKKEETINPIT
jgi:hypothetical protein